MTNADTQWLAVTRFLGHEAFMLDKKDWDGWLGLYTEDAVYWVPAWDDHERLTADPNREISLIYYPNRGGLEDRVFRIRTGRSSASTPGARTSHMFTLLSVADKGDLVQARSSWSVTSVLEGAVTTYHGSAQYELIPARDSFLIQRKETIVINDLAQTMLDVYSI
ncbi:aromatic-ring-hydroxylating dioxygenase subunit beta [Novosphingobium sp. Gsoil 351]|uniref:aromatic-ring-hydroxylating dioxygenase subunit beta n=1 Tax=Novosphingobium sp. Gsoil 351 TaxID=2675225 RepID=UPI0012B4D5B7|nr:aromatic-ring-hydroxylating dioxygenase subunit beta [Novosphingobium sp. Gsoil 351]QGN54016.1 benzene 1,2-dioxygenase [Novosphingobium sp. Gsoil 351]